MEVVCVLIALFLIVLPVIMLIFGSFWSSSPRAPGFFTFENYIKPFHTPWYVETTLNTFAVGAGTVLVASLFGVPLAWIVSRTNVPAAKVLETVSISPIFISPFMGSIAWILLASPKIGLLNTFLNQLLPSIGAVFNIYSYWGLIWVMGIFYSPYIFLFASGALLSMDPSLEEQSRVSGSSLLHTTTHVTLPLVLPAIMSGVLLVFVLALGHFSITLLLGWSVGYYVIPTKLFTLISHPPTQYGLATTMSIVLLVASIVGIYLSRKITGKKGFATITGKGFRPSLIDLGRGRYLVFAFALFCLIVIAILPIVLIVLTSFETRTLSLQFTADNYSELLFGILGPLFWKALSNSLFVALFGSTICMLLTIVISWTLIRTKVRGRGIIDYITTFSLAIPGVVMGIGLLWTWISIPMGIYGTIWILVIACIAHFISYGIRSTSSTLVQIQGELEESSRISGSSWAGTLRRITLPLLKPGIASGWILLFIVFFREVSMVVFLWNYNTITISILAIDLFKELSYPLFCALGVFQAAVILAVVLIFKKLLGAEINQLVGT